MQRIFVIEDNFLHREFIVEEISRFKSRFEIFFDIIPIDQFLSFKKNIHDLNLQDTDIFFIDIDLNSFCSGIDIAQEIRKYNTQCNIVFITNDSSKALEIVTKNIIPFDYIQKLTSNLSEIRNQIQNTLKLLFKHSQIDSNKYLTLQKNNEYHIFAFSDINYIQTLKGSRFRVYLQTMDKEFILNTSFSKIKKMFFPEYYLKSLKFYIINLRQIKQVNPKLGIIIFLNDSELIVGEKIMRKVREGLRQII
ncbi:LytR/AlgR family response regulator transcription factor [Enterococcus mundtii]|uniref:Response regulatory domain-containing protein n=1 Tax=Enterococcus mundtii TaxID=53346 RepID=A0A242KUE6_ENTMU|nr:LytTR family transcriptional regulator DNA-binding domain-containing protein [Enterococcus mundtii]OTP24855.1 hypothetical protein A5802_003010 [Enterococcus mundtii]